MDIWFLVDLCTARPITILPGFDFRGVTAG
jgi:hypothetical protein